MERSWNMLSACLGPMMTQEPRSEEDDEVDDEDDNEDDEVVEDEAA